MDVCMHWSLYGVCSSPISPPELPEETKTDKRQFGHEGTPPPYEKVAKIYHLVRNSIQTNI